MGWLHLVERVPPPDGFLELDGARCDGCGRCVRVCVSQVWRIRHGRALLAPDHAERCLECGACALVCEPEAIAFRYPTGGTGVVYVKG